MASGIIDLPQPLRNLVQSVQPTLSSGQSEKDQVQVNEWLNRLQTDSPDILNDLSALDKELTPKTYLVGNQLTVADVALYGAVYPKVSKLPSSTYYTLPSLTRWFDHVQNDATVQKTASTQNLPLVPFDIDNAPKIERKAETSAKKEKKEKAAAAASASASANATPAPTGTSSSKAPALADEKAPLAPAAGKTAKGEKKEKKPKAEASAAGDTPPAKPAKAQKAAPAPSPATDESKPLPCMIDLRVGHIVDIKKHPDADSLYVEQIDLGEPEGPRTVVSGLVHYIPIEQMKDRWLIAVCNLKPASMRGIKSSAMVLCATSKEGKEGGIEVLQVPVESRIPGARVYFEGEEFEGKEPLPQLNPKKKVFETIQPGFITLPSREAAWVNPETGSVHRIRTKDGPCTAATLVGASLS